MKYNILGMSCSACVTRVEKAVGSLEGVDEVTVSLLTNSMTVEGKAEPAKVIRAVAEAGYEAAVADCEFEGESKGNKETHTLTMSRRAVRLLISFAFLGVLFFLEFNHYYLSDFGPVKSYFYRGILQCVVAIVIIILNRHYYSGGLKALFKGAPNMNTLVFIGSFTAFIYSLIMLIGQMTGHIGHIMSADEIIKPEALGEKLYFVTSGMILTFISIGKSLEESSKDKTTEAIKGLYKLAPSRAVLISEDSDINEKRYTEIDVKDLKTDDVVLIKAGNYFPVDGIVVKGEGFADESSLTGESVPVKKCKGDEVYTSTVLLKGTLSVKTEKVGSKTVLGSIIDMVLEAGSKKAPIAKLADRVAGVFVPFVMVVSAITFAAWFISGSGVGFAIARAIAVLVVSCPCAMGLATPVAIMAGSGAGAKYGILFKDAETLETAGKVSLVALDKTGTITEGNVTLPEDLPGNIQVKTSGDELKADSKKAISLLKNLNLEVVMVSGDRKETAEKIAALAGIDEIVCEVLPGQKADEIKKLKNRGSVMMVGDGINDSVALVEADVGVALGTGKDVAIDAADIVLMRKSLVGVSDAIRLSRLTLRKIKQNLFWAFIYNIIGIPLAAGVLIPKFGIELPPMYSAAMMSISSLIVVMNALTINGFRPSYEIKINNDNEDIKQEGVVMKYTMNIEGMMCAHCEARVKKCLEEIDGVEKAVVSHEDGSAVVTASQDVTADVLSAAVMVQGYEVISIE